MSERPSQRPRERRPSWSQLQVVRKPNKPRDDSPCSRKRPAAHPGEKRTTDHRTCGGEIGGIEGSIIRFFGKGVVSRSSKKGASPEKKKKKKKEKERGRDGGHRDCPRPAESGCRVVESASPKTAASKTDVPGTDVAKTRATDTDASTTEAAKTEALDAAAARPQTEKTTAPTSERPKTPVPDTDVSNAPTTDSPAQPRKKALKAPARPGPKQEIAKQQDETGPAATPPAGPSPACTCACACAKSEEEGKGTPKAGGRAGEQPEGESAAAAPVNEASPGGARPGEDEKGRTAAELCYSQEPGPAGRVDSSWLGTFRDRLMG
ncbi:hypothetical protein LZ31DRAFT_552397 [Colletotrichum somersetense]|nr:hypothetical protein LZ31DRAFT_552397 [Colletotrichum somersetense]